MEGLGTCISCPYAADGKYCKHMAAVLYKWSAGAGDKRSEAAKLVEDAAESEVRSFLADILMENEKLLLRFKGRIHKDVTRVDEHNYFRQVDAIAENHLGRDYYIDYYEAYSFISELEELIDEDVRQMIDNGNYSSAFNVVNYIFMSVGNIDMDDSDGCLSMLAEDICQVWKELLSKANAEEKRKMFDWFISHLNGSVIDYLEDYIERILMEGFDEKEYEQDKISLIEDRLAKSESEDSTWSREYNVGKWAVRYLELLDKGDASDEQVDIVCRKYWTNSSVREYCIDRFMRNKQYDKALQALDESIVLDKNHYGLIAKYSEKKKEIYLVQGNMDAYLKQLWQLVLEDKAGDMTLYRELKSRYSREEWIIKREEVFDKLRTRSHLGDMVQLTQREGRHEMQEGFEKNGRKNTYDNRHQSVGKAYR